MLPRFAEKAASLRRQCYKIFLLPSKRKRNQNRSHIFPCPSANATSTPPLSRAPRGVHTSSSPHLTSPPPKPLPFSCSFSRLLPPQLLSPPPPPLLHASSTTQKQELEKKYERFSSPTNAVLIRMGSTDRKVRACARAALSVVSLACVI